MTGSLIISIGSSIWPLFKTALIGILISHYNKNTHHFHIPHSLFQVNTYIVRSYRFIIVITRSVTRKTFKAKINKFTRLTMDQLVYIILAINKVHSTKEGPGLQILIQVPTLFHAIMVSFIILFFMALGFYCIDDDDDHHDHDDYNDDDDDNEFSPLVSYLSLWTIVY